MIKQGGDPKKTFFKFLAGVSTTIAAVADAMDFRVLTDEDNSVNRSAMDALRYSNCNRSLFIYFFQFDFGCTK